MFTVRYVKRIIMLVLLVSFPSMGELRATAKDIVGVVTSVSGVWFADGVKVSRGQKLLVGATITAKEPNVKYARIVVMLLDFSERSRICDRKGLCAEPLRLPDSVNRASQPRSLANERPGFWERLISAINRSREPKFAKTFARGGPNISDQIVKRVQGGIDLKPLFSGMKAGQFLINVEVITNDDNKSNGWIVERQPINWTGRGPVILNVSAPVPALYRISFVQGTDRRRTLPDDVWVLVVESRRYGMLSADYQKVRSAVADWDLKTDPYPSEVLRAFLADLLHYEEP